MILGADTSTAIHHKHHHVSFGHGLAGLLGHFLVDAAIARIGLETTCVYHNVFTGTEATIAIVAVTGQARVVGHDGIPGFGQAIEES